jgi:hypothetical protein
MENFNKQNISALRKLLEQEEMGDMNRHNTHHSEKYEVATHFENHCELPDFSIGKIILCREGASMRLYGDLRPLPALQDMKVDYAEHYFYELSRTNSEKLATTYGYHRDIDHEGEIIGGAIVMVHDGKVYVTGKSSDFGPIKIKDFKQCLPDREVVPLNMGFE